MRLNRIFIIIAALTLSFQLSALSCLRAETVYLKDGTVIKGEIISIDDFFIMVRTGVETIPVFRDDIKRIEKEKAGEIKAVEPAEIELNEAFVPELSGKIGIGINWPGIQARYCLTNDLLVEGKLQFSSNNTTIGGRIYCLFMKIPGDISILPYFGGSFSRVISPYLTGGFVTGGFAGLELINTKNIGLGADAGIYYVSLTSAIGSIDDLGLLFNFGVTYYFE